MESSKTKTGRIRVAKKKTKKKAKRKVYFGMEVQDAIVRYNDSNNDDEGSVKSGRGKRMSFFGQNA